MLAVAMIGLLSACNGGGGDADETTTTSAPPAKSAEVSTTSTTSALSSVTTAPVVSNMKPDEIAVRNLLDVFAYESTLAYEVSDPDRPGLLATMSGEFKDQVVSGLTKARAAGERSVRPGGGVSPHQTRNVRWLSDDEAVAIECWMDDMVVYKEGESPGTVEPARISFRTTVTREADQQWRISSQVQQSPADTAGSCVGF